MIRTKNARKVMTALLALFLVLSSIPPAYGASDPFYLLTNVNFENDDTPGFNLEEGTEVSKESEGESNHYLKVAGTSSAVKTLAEPVKGDQVQINFDWRPDDISSAEKYYSATAVMPPFSIDKRRGYKRCY